MLVSVKYLNPLTNKSPSVIKQFLSLLLKNLKEIVFDYSLALKCTETGDEIRFNFL